MERWESGAVRRGQPDVAPHPAAQLPGARLLLAAHGGDGGGRPGRRDRLGRRRDPRRASWTAAKIFSFIAAVMLLYQPVKQLGRVSQMALQGAAAGERVFEILDTPTAVPGQRDRRAGARSRRPSATRRSPSPTATRRCCTASTWSIRKGEVVALVGGVGRRQDHRGQPAAALLGPDRRADHRRRPGRPRRDPGEPARAARAGHPGDRPLQRHHPQQHRLRLGRTSRWPRWSGPPAWRRPTTSSRRMPQGYDTRVGEKRDAALRRPAPAAGHRPRLPQGRPHPHPRRGHQRPRRRERARGAARPRAAHGARHRRATGPRW